MSDTAGYELENEGTFGVGTLKPCPHSATAIYNGATWLIHGNPPSLYDASAWVHPGDKIGTRRCMGCGNVVEHER